MSAWNLTIDGLLHREFIFIDEFANRVRGKSSGVKKSVYFVPSFLQISFPFKAFDIFFQYPLSALRLINVGFDLAENILNPLAPQSFLVHLVADTI